MQAMEEKPQLAVEGKDPASDEEIARRLQQQLNGEAAAAARRRTRKQPTFYSPQQSGGYSGYHGVEYPSMEGEGREGEDAAELEQAPGALQAGRQPEAEAAMPASPSARRGQPEASSPTRFVKEEEGMAPQKGSNSLSGRELRALMRSNQERDAGTVDTKPGSTRGSSGRGVDSGAGSGSGGEGEAEVGTPRASARRLKGKRQRSNLGQPQIKDEHGLKSKDSGQSSLDGESASDNEDQSQGDPSGPPGKRRMRKIPKLPMVRHGRKWYRARLLKDSGQRVQIEFTGFEEVNGSIPLPRESDRIWRGSYKGKDWRYLGDGAWEPKERASKKPGKASSNPKTSSRPTSSNAHAQQSSDAPSSAEDARPVNDPDPDEREAQSPRMMEPNQIEAATKPQQPQRKLSQKRAAPERLDRHTKKGHLEPLDTEDIPQEAASPADEQALSTGAVKPETPAKGMESKPAPGDAGTDSGSDDEAKQLQSAAEQELRNHRKRKADILKQNASAAPEGDSEAVLAQIQTPGAVSVPEHADADNKTAVAAAAEKEAAEEAATGEAAAMLASMASEEHGDETGLQCEEALPAEEHAGKSVAGSPSVPSSQARVAEQHLGWKFGWKKSHKKQTDGVSSDSGDKPSASARVPEPTMSPKSLRPARRTRKPLKIDNPYDDAIRQMTPAPAPSAQDVPMQSPFATPPDSEYEKEPEVRAPSSGRGRGGRRGGRGAQRGGRGRGGGRWAHHRAALAAAALNGSAAEDASGNEGLHDAGSGVQPALAQRPVRTLKPSSKILAASHSNRSPSPPPTRRGRSASAGPTTAPLPASRGLVAFSGLMDAMSALDGPRASVGRLSNASSQSWDSRNIPANTAGVQTLPGAWPAASLGGGGTPLFGGLEARWRFNAHRKILEASEKLMPAQQPASPSALASSIVHPHPPPVPLFQ